MPRVSRRSTVARVHLLSGRRGSRVQSGAASLIVVMVLFFLMALVAGYTSRNLIFEQRTGLNQLRSTQAYEAAEAGLEWALAKLNSGRIGDNCLEAGATINHTTFRQRYLTINSDTGIVSPRMAPTVGLRLWPSCVADGAGGWNCDCPSDAAPALPAPAGTGVFPAFRVRFKTDPGLTRAGLIRIESNGCTRLADACLNHPASAAEMEGQASVSVIVALTPALPTPPGAALTVVGDIAPGSAVTVYNTDATLGGVTVHASGVGPPAAWTLRSLPGTPPSTSVFAPDMTLAAPGGAPNRAFAAAFNAWPDTYRQQPAAIAFDCPLAGCREALADKVALNPDRVIWVRGDLTLESAGDIGSPPNPLDPTVPGPAMIVVNGQVNFTAPDVRIYGTVYSRGGGWTGPGSIEGAVVVEGNLAATAAFTVAMNNTILQSLRLRSGSFVRAPGGWDDFRKREP